MKEYTADWAANPLETAYDYLHGLALKACKEERPHDVRYLMTQAETMLRIGRRVADMKLPND